MLFWLLPTPILLLVFTARLWAERPSRGSDGAFQGLRTPSVCQSQYLCFSGGGRYFHLSACQLLVWVRFSAFLAFCAKTGFRHPTLFEAGGPRGGGVFRTF